MPEVGVCMLGLRTEWQTSAAPLGTSMFDGDSPEYSDARQKGGIGLVGCTRGVAVTYSVVGIRSRGL